LQIWRKMLNWDRVGLIVFFFIPAVWQVQMVKPTLFCIFSGMTVFKMDEATRKKIDALFGAIR